MTNVLVIFIQRHKYPINTTGKTNKNEFTHFNIFKICKILIDNYTISVIMDCPPFFFIKAVGIWHIFYMQINCVLKPFWLPFCTEICSALLFQFQ